MHRALDTKRPAGVTPIRAELGYGEACSLGLARLFDEDRELGQWLSETTLAKARRQIVVDTYTAKRCTPLPDALLAPPGRPPLGCLVLDGFVAQSVQLDVRRGLAVVGPGDVFCPWQRHGWAAALPYDEQWVALSRVRVAVLDAEFEHVCAHLPGA